MLNNIPPPHVRHATSDLPLAPDLALVDALQQIKYKAASPAEAQAIAADALQGPLEAVAQHQAVFAGPMQSMLMEAIDALRQIASLEAYTPEAGQIARAVLEKLGAAFW